MEGARRKTLILLGAGLGILATALYFGTPTQGRASLVRSPSQAALEDGDIVLRRGEGWLSDMARNFSTGEKRFSHVGLLHREGDTLWVVHSVQDREAGYNGIVREPIHGFLRQSSDWAVYRLNLPPEQRREIARRAEHYTTVSIRFDNHYDLHTREAMYCSEFLYHVVNDVAGNSVIRAGTRVMDRDFVSIEDVYRRSDARLVEDAGREFPPAFTTAHR